MNQVLIGELQLFDLIVILAVRSNPVVYFIFQSESLYENDKCPVPAGRNGERQCHSCIDWLHLLERGKTLSRMANSLGNFADLAYINIVNW
jgi:hypothetical protein